MLLGVLGKRSVDNIYIYVLSLRIIRVSHVRLLHVGATTELWIVLSGGPTMLAETMAHLYICLGLLVVYLALRVATF